MIYNSIPYNTFDCIYNTIDCDMETPKLFKNTNIDIEEIQNIKYFINPCMENNEWCGCTCKVMYNLWDIKKLKFNLNKNRILGDAQFIKLSDDVTMVNSIILKENNMFSSGAFRYIFAIVNNLAFRNYGTIHIYKSTFPKNINWKHIERIISETMSVDTYIHLD